MNVRALVYVSIFTTIVSILSIVSIPTPWGIPFTLQTFAIALCGVVLGKKYGVLSTILYLILGAIGLPVFSGLSGGIGRFVSVSGGFLFGFPFIAFFCGIKSKSIFLSTLYGIIGLLICHLFGIVQFKILTNTSFINSAIIVSLQYLIKDIISVVLACIIGSKIKKILHKTNM